MDVQPEPPPAQRRAWRILVVDDDAMSASVQSQMLHLLGCEASSETDSDRALERAAAESFDLLLVDLSMPGVDGFELLRRLRADEAKAQRPEVPLIAVTGLAQPEARDRCLQAGFADHLAKPVLVSKLQEVVERVLGVAAPPQSRSSRDATGGDAEQLRSTVKRLSEMTQTQERFAPSLIEAFALRSAQLIDLLHAAIDDADHSQALRHAQALEANARLLGARRLSIVSADLARHCEAGDWVQARRQLHEFENQHQAVLTVLFQIDR